MAGILSWLWGKVGGTPGVNLPPIRPGLDNSGLTWVMRDDFTTAQKPVVWPRTAVPGPGALFARDTAAGDPFVIAEGRLRTPALATASWLWAGPFPRAAGRTFIFRGIASKRDNYIGAFGLSPFVSADSNPFIVSEGSLRDETVDYRDAIISWTANAANNWTRPLLQFVGGVWDSTAVSGEIAAVTGQGVDVAIVLHTAGYVAYYRVGRSRDWYVFDSSTTENNAYIYMSVTGGANNVSLASLRVIDAPQVVIDAGAVVPTGPALNWLRRAVM
jgi:hypothetical protein